MSFFAAENKAVVSIFSPFPIYFLVSSYHFYNSILVTSKLFFILHSLPYFSPLLKFIYSEKATKIWRNLLVDSFFTFKNSIHTSNQRHIVAFSEYRKVASTSPSRLEAHADFFRLSMKGKFNIHLLWAFGKKVDLHIINTR